MPSQPADHRNLPPVGRRGREPGWRGEADRHIRAAPAPAAGLTLAAGRATGQAAVAVRTLFLIRASIAAMPRSRSGLTACASPSAT